MLYQIHEFQRGMLSPLTAWAQIASKSFVNPASPLAYIPGSNHLAAGYELLYRLCKDYEKPEFELHQIVKDGHNIPIVEQRQSSRSRSAAYCTSSASTTTAPPAPS